MLAPYRARATSPRGSPPPTTLLLPMQAFWRLASSASRRAIGSARTCNSVAMGSLLAGSGLASAAAFGLAPTELAGASAAGAGKDTRTETRVYTWGGGVHGQLGHGSQVVSQSSPALVEALQDVEVVDLSAGYVSSAALSSDGRVWTFGGGAGAKLGHGYSMNVPNETVPRLVEGLSGVRVAQLSVGGTHMAVVDSNGHVWSWGDHHFGQLGHRCARAVGSSPWPAAPTLTPHHARRVAMRTRASRTGWTRRTSGARVCCKCLRASRTRAR